MALAQIEIANRTIAHSTDSCFCHKAVSAMNVQFNNDGSKMFIGGRASRAVYEYSLSRSDK